MKSIYLTTTNDTTTLLDIPLEVENYACGIIEMSGTIQDDKSPLYLCCDIIEESPVGIPGKEFGNVNYLPVLRQLNINNKHVVKGNIAHVVWIKVLRHQINSIRLYITSATGEITTFEENKLNCTLLFIPPKESKKC